LEKLSASPINNIAQTFAHPQAIARQVYQEVEVRSHLQVYTDS
jgi:crotonobetainyl-CoA:carnitine CoA-transferase CaiB-like acyl-CoA transferase